MEFYAKNVEGARKIMEQIRLLGKEKISCREQYEKKRHIEEKKKELSEYSKDALGKELENVKSAIEFLHSPLKEEQGLTSRFFSFIKSIAHN